MPPGCLFGNWQGILYFETHQRRVRGTMQVVSVRNVSIFSPCFAYFWITSTYHANDATADRDPVLTVFAETYIVRNICSYFPSFIDYEVWNLMEVHPCLEKPCLQHILQIPQPPEPSDEPKFMSSHEGWMGWTDPSDWYLDEDNHLEHQGYLCYMRLKQIALDKLEGKPCLKKAVHVIEEEFRFLHEHGYIWPPKYKPYTWRND